MSFGFGPGDVIAVINGAIKVYDKIKNAKEQIDDVGDRLQEVVDYLDPVEQQLKSRYGSKKNYPQVESVWKTCKRMEDDAKEVTELLQRWYDKEAPGGLEWRSEKAQKYFARIIFSMDSSPKKLEDLIQALERRSAVLDRQINNMNQNYQQEQVDKLRQQLHIQTPGSRRKKKEVSVLFVDRSNTGRSVIAAAYTTLLQHWTQSKAGHMWPLDSNKIHSAGLHVQHLSSILSIQKSALPNGMDVAGNESPVPLALDALFDNSFFTKNGADRYKFAIQSQTKAYRSRGFGRNVFRDYDYIFVFNLENYAGIQKLKASVKKELGEEYVPKGKAKTRVLGEYGNWRSKEKHAGEVQIYDPPKVTVKTQGPDGKEVETKEQNRDGWNRVTGKIKVCIRRWLKEELEWDEPTKKSKPAQDKKDDT